MPNNSIPFHIGFVALTSILYLGHFISAHVGTEGLNCAYQATTKCIDIEDQPGFKKEVYDACLESLESIVWSLVNSNSLDLTQCKVDIKKKSDQALCKVWIWCIPRSILITNKELVDYIKQPAWNKPPIPRQKGKNTATMALPASSPKKMPSTRDFLKYKMTRVNDRVNSWRSSAESYFKNMGQNTVGLANEAKTNVVDQYKDLKGKAEDKIDDAMGDFSDFADSTKKKVKEGMNKANKMVDKFQDKADKKLEKVKQTSKTHVERTKLLANELKGRAEDTARYTRDSVRELGGKLGQTWKKPIPSMPSSQSAVHAGKIAE